MLRSPGQDGHKAMEVSVANMVSNLKVCLGSNLCERESVVGDSIFCSAYLPSRLFTYGVALSILVLVLMPGVFHMFKLTP
jgi:hypothetical protein